MAPKQSKLDLSAIKTSKKRGGKKDRKWHRNKVKCAEYRNRVGKPRGPGVAGNKSGKNKN